MSLESKTYLKTPIGVLEIIGTKEGVSSIIFKDDFEGKISENVPEVLQESLKQLKEYFFEDRKEFSFKLNPKGTDFQLKVWKLLSEISYGKSISYSEQSERFGDLKAIRAIASANGKNPISVVIPCHRVIGKSGELTGYAGGIWRKKWLLEKEGIIEKQMTLF
ncbi:methylated-DNA--[protein]-cysteine S-methyltransferase [Aureivirga sp. CE67]|uniref:methylated-DNA--[protein]-cysteine S-methyltransferase n=1 Tax=Aureivirga sp. CE67 TaxID=1788983 RepID=UPI0018CBCF68|nr:methylated-DNA--[protein]-cysteine S-methyltransferase [Aureivirga sp. CE67]